MHCTACGKRNTDSTPYCSACGTFITIPPSECASPAPDIDCRDVSLESGSVADNAPHRSTAEIKGGAWRARREALRRKLSQLPMKPLTAGVVLTMEEVLDVLADKVRIGNSGSAYLPISYGAVRIGEDEYVAWLHERRGRTYRSHHVDIDLGLGYKERQKYEIALTRKKKRQI
jgi:hypothetical protein